MDKNNQASIQKIEEITGKTYDEMKSLLSESGLSKHGDIRTLFMSKLDLTYGYANTLALIITKSDGASLSEGKSMEALLREIYSGKKEHFLPMHLKIMARLESFGQFEIAPKKGYLSLRLNKQFAMIGPKTNSRMEIGINIKDYQGNDLLIEQKKGSMCKFIVKITSERDITEDLFDWLKIAYEQAK